MNKEITSLKQFPTEVILHFYKKNRMCRTDSKSYHRHYNCKTRKVEYWIPFYGEWTDRGLTYTICLGYTKSTAEECHKMFTNIRCKYDRYWNEDGYYYGYNEWNYGDEIEFVFDRLYWKGTIKEIKEELNNREHIGTFSNKDYRKWLINYRKNKVRK